MGDGNADLQTANRSAEVGQPNVYKRQPEGMIAR
ncbi:MAG: hypothetical protein JWP59_90 [Massilia sp.]|nr:hypothetical protein [Massilia sp.]